MRNRIGGMFLVLTLTALALATSIAPVAASGRWGG